MQEIKCRTAPSLGDGFAGTPEQVWGTKSYNPETDSEKPCVFFGLYGLPDFYTLWRHKGKRWILWAGSDITHFVNGYWLEDGGDIRLPHEPLAEWINKNCESWVENEVERQALEDAGITAQVCPSFLGNIDDYEVSSVAGDRPKVYMSVSGDNFSLYGWDILEEVADKCEVEFHLYGNKTPWITRHSNVYVHGRVSQEEMNEQISKMQCGLRLNSGVDGFSEVLAKSVLWGQYPATWLSYKYKQMDSFEHKGGLIKTMNVLKSKQYPNPAREYYRKVVNQYPWHE